MSNTSIGFFAEEVPEKLYFAGKEITFNENYYRYAAAKAAFAPIAQQSKTAMLQRFEDKIGSLDSFIEYGVSWIREELSDFLSFTMEQLALNGCYTLGEDDFYEKYVVVKLDNIPAIYDEMEEALNDLRQAQEERNERRVAERRAKAAAGEDELAAMMWNGLKRSIDGGANLMKAAMIYDDKVKEKIKDEFMYLCDSMVDSFADALYEEEKIDLRDPVSLEDYRRISALTKNILENKIPESRVDEIALEIFSKCPYQSSFLEWAVGHFGDADGSLQQIADAFYIKIDSVKNTLLDKAFEVIDFSSEESVMTGKVKYLEAEHFLNTKSETYLNKIENALEEFDLKFRTVNGAEYASREEAAAAREELQKVEDICKKHNPHTIHEFNALIEELRNSQYRTDVCSKKISELENKIGELTAQNEKFVNTLNISQEDAFAIVAKMELIRSSGIKGVRCVDPASKLSKDILAAHEGDISDIVMGMIDTSMTENYSAGIVISKNGIYFKGEDCFLKKAATTYGKFVNIATFGIAGNVAKGVGATGKTLFKAIPGLSAAKKSIEEKLETVPGLSDAANAIKDSIKTKVIFIPWENVSAAQSGSNNTISLSREYDFKFPFMSCFGAKPEVELIELLNTLAKM